MQKEIRVLIVDDSALVRQILTQALEIDPEIEVIGTASDPYMARDKIMRLKPNVLTLDVEMPRMDGIEFLKRLMPQYPIPVLMVSSSTERGEKRTIEALEAGAIDFITKPSSNLGYGLNRMVDELLDKVKTISKVNVDGWKKLGYLQAAKSVKPVQSVAEPTRTLIAIGASTGGTEALREALTQLSPDTPGIIVVQHMPAGFTKKFAERLNEQCLMAVQEAKTGDQVERGKILIAPGAFQTTVVRSGEKYFVECKKGKKVSGHMPSVDVLFQSIARTIGANAIGIVLTGMGYDGADGLLAMKKAGARTMAQDKATSIVYGMPKEAYERGGADLQVPIQKIAGKIEAFVREKN